MDACIVNVSKNQVGRKCSICDNTFYVDFIDNQTICNECKNTIKEMKEFLNNMKKEREEPKEIQYELCSTGSNGLITNEGKVDIINRKTVESKARAFDIIKENFRLDISDKILIIYDDLTDNHFVTSYNLDKEDLDVLKNLIEEE